MSKASLFRRIASDIANEANGSNAYRKASRAGMTPSRAQQAEEIMQRRNSRIDNIMDDIQSKQGDIEREINDDIHSQWEEYLDDMQTDFENSIDYGKRWQAPDWETGERSISIDPSDWMDEPASFEPSLDDDLMDRWDALDNRRYSIKLGKMNDPRQAYKRAPATGMWEKQLQTDKANKEFGAQFGYAIAEMRKAGYTDDQILKLLEAAPVRQGMIDAAKYKP